MHEFGGNVPEPGSERGPWAVAITLGLLGAAVLALTLSGVLGGRSNTSVSGPPAVLAATPTPMPAPSVDGGGMAAVSASSQAAASRARAAGGARALVGGVGRTRPIQSHRDFASYQAQTATHIAERWMQSFYPIYATAQHTFGVNWLLIASIHRQESAFSTAPGIYHGLNFAHCCGGPMQFNVTNGDPTRPSGESNSTWALVSDSYRYGARPPTYGHMTARHPSIYDDFDAIMAAAHLLSADGAGAALDGSAWNAAYDYYGHDATGVAYADQVLARAISWSQHGFCINCGVPAAMVQAVHAAYGAPVAATFAAATVAHRASTPRRPGRSTPRPHGR